MLFLGTTLLCSSFQHHRLYKSRQTLHSLYSESMNLQGKHFHTHFEFGLDRSIQPGSLKLLKLLQNRMSLKGRVCSLFGFSLWWMCCRMCLVGKESPSWNSKFPRDSNFGKNMTAIKGFLSHRCRELRHLARGDS
jgi:hypothetical protein